MPSNETDLKEIAYLKSQIKSLKRKQRGVVVASKNQNQNREFLEMTEEYQETPEGQNSGKFRNSEVYNSEDNDTDFDDSDFQLASESGNDIDNSQHIEIIDEI